MTRRSPGTCLSQMREIPWSQILFGDDPYLVLVLLLVGGFVFYPLFSEYFPAVLVVLVLAILVRAWLWCRSMSQEATRGASREDDKGSP